MTVENRQTVAAVVVTYNRFELLKKCIQSLREQTRKLDEIIVVNNSSTDGTLEWLSSQDDLTVITQLNLGGAGGFHTGINTAYEKGYDWVCCLDDDCKLNKNYIKILLSYTKRNEYFLLGGKVLTVNDEILIHHRGLFNMDKVVKEQIQIPLSKTDYANEVIEVDFISFVGFLIHKKVIEKVGYPNKKMFISHDDVEYCIRIHRFFKLYLIPQAIVVHHERYVKYLSHLQKFKIKNQIQVKNNSIKLFYISNRNLCFIIKVHFTNNIVKWFSILNIAIVKLRRIIFFNQNKIVKLKVLFYSLKDGIQGNFNRDFNS